MSRPPRSPGGRPPGGPTNDRPPSGTPSRPPSRRIREQAGGEALTTNPREANRRANQVARPMVKRPEAGSVSNPFGGRPVKVPRGRDEAVKAPRANNAPRRDRGVARAEAAAAAPGKIEPQRIAKLLARAGVGSRRDIERFIADGRVAIHGTVLTTPAHIIHSLEGVTFDSRPVAAIEATRLFRFHKPAGFLTTARDPGGRPTIFDALPPGLPRLVPVGRLDMNTEGLLLLTTDGTLKRLLELPVNAVSRCYRVRAYGEVTQAILEGLIEGIEIDGMRYGPINADIERRTGRNLWLAITLTEGKNREIRRVLEFLGLQVSRLIRVAYGPFELGDLPARAVEEVNPQAIDQLRKSVAKAK
jgi:23S rRNA pseudouridine2605 synthase